MTITRFGLVPCSPRVFEGSSAAACSAVDSRETKMEPTLPGKPMRNSIGLGMRKGRHERLTTNYYRK